MDERGEIAVLYQGIPQMDVGGHTDVLDACPKAIGIPILLRSANPQIIAVDEITVREDLQAMAARPRAAACAFLRRSTRLTGRSWGKSRSSGGCCATGYFHGS